MRSVTHHLYTKTIHATESMEDADANLLLWNRHTLIHINFAALLARNLERINTRGSREADWDRHVCLHARLCTSIMCIS